MKRIKWVAVEAALLPVKAVILAAFAFLLAGSWVYKRFSIHSEW
jgi:hypothetical protein